MSEASEPPKTGPDGRPLGPDGKPLPGPQQMQQVMAQRRMAQQQAQVDEVVGIMRNNVEKVLERDQKLNELDEKADALQAMIETGFLGKNLVNLDKRPVYKQQT